MFSMKVFSYCVLIASFAALAGLGFVMAWAAMAWTLTTDQLGFAGTFGFLAIMAGFAGLTFSCIEAADKCK